MNRELGEFLDTITKQGGIDLHSHSTASDGSLKAEEVYDLARAKGLSFFALTDHDTIDGVLALMDRHHTLESVLEQKNLSLKDLRDDRTLKEIKLQTKKEPILVPGLELSVLYLDQEVHLLAYFIGSNIKKLSHFLARERDRRYARNKAMLARFKELGINVPQNLLDPSPDQPSPGRVKLAAWLLAHGHADSISDAFNLYLSEGRPAYVPKQRVKIQEALNLIDRAQGFPVIAHPQQYGWCQSRTLLQKKIQPLEALTNQQLGIEAYHGRASLEDKKLLQDFIQKAGIKATAGSDFHGSHRPESRLYDYTANPGNFYSNQPYEV